MFTKAAKLSNVDPGGVISANVNGVDVAICNVDGTIYAVSRACGHAGAALSLGTLNRHIITCPLHFAQFDVRDGKALLGPCPRDYGLPNRKVEPERETKDLRTFLVKVEGDDILIDVQ